MSATARNAFAVTPHDTNPNAYDALQVGGAGTVVFTDIDDTEITMTVPAGGYVLCRTKLVKTASTATLIVGLRL